MGDNRQRTKISPVVNPDRYQKILQKNGLSLTDDNIKLCEQLFQLADIIIAFFLENKKSGLYSDLLLDGKQKNLEEERMS